MKRLPAMLLAFTLLSTPAWAISQPDVDAAVRTVRSDKQHNQQTRQALKKAQAAGDQKSIRNLSEQLKKGRALRAAHQKVAASTKHQFQIEHKVPPTPTK